jgi:predicted DNA binding CopG/RHH family protein
MKKKIEYTDEPMGRLVRINDFLPPPELLVLKDDKIKVTIELKKKSVDFFKKEANKQKKSYQQMIREVLDIYASHYQGER